MPFTESLKAAVRKKAHQRCCLCHDLGVEIHHIIPQEENGLDDEDNAAPLCPSCHETYGANPVKRKFVREARDHWFEICERRYATDPDRLDELKGLMKNAVTYEDFEKFKSEIIETFASTLDTPRTEEEIIAATDRFFDQVWYNRHLYYKACIADGSRSVDPEIWKMALAAARRVKAKMAKADLPPYTDFEWGMINGKLSALRWVLGDDWDFLDT